LETSLNGVIFFGQPRNFSKVAMMFVLELQMNIEDDYCWLLEWNPLETIGTSFFCAASAHIFLCRNQKKPQKFQKEHLFFWGGVSSFVAGLPTRKLAKEWASKRIYLKKLNPHRANCSELSPTKPINDGCD